MQNSQFSDLHCHPHLKPYARSFANHKKTKQSLWYAKEPTFWSKLFNVVTGITRFSQCDFTTMAKGNVKLAFVSLYPFEKGFFVNKVGKGIISAVISTLISGIEYKRIRNLQNHTNYFEDLCNEYEFLVSGRKRHRIDGREVRWCPAATWEEAEKVLQSNQIAVVLTIEGAHVFNTGLETYGRTVDAEEILNNVRTVKNWTYAPVFITLAHNFNNDLCGHTRSLEPLEPFVDQRENLGCGFTKLGEKVVSLLLGDQTGRRIYVDLKHMSLQSRKAYYDFLNTHYPQTNIPLIVSHGAVTGTNYKGESSLEYDTDLFYKADINFYDEEIIEVARTGGLFGIQLDRRRITNRSHLKSILDYMVSSNPVKQSAVLVWRQIRYIAELLDQHGLFSWGTACIGSDFDGGINPLNGIMTAKDFSAMAEALHTLTERYLEGPNRLSLPENKNISSDEVITRFCYTNAVNFLREFY